MQDEDLPAVPPPDFDIAKVKQLILAGSTIPQAWMPFVSELNFAFENHFNLEPLSQLRRLRSLDLTKVPIQDLTPLEGLAELRELRLGDTDVTDINPLANLRHLCILDLTNTRASDVSALRNLSSLTLLYILKAPIADLGPLAALRNLTIVGSADQFSGYRRD